MTNSKHAFPVASNVLNREFKAEAPNEKWVGDINYLQPKKAGCIWPQWGVDINMGSA